jgi:hypothetical protein
VATGSSEHQNQIGKSETLSKILDAGVGFLRQPPHPLTLFLPMMPDFGQTSEVIQDSGTGGVVGSWMTLPSG